MTGGVGGRATQSLTLPGVPKSPNPYFVVEMHQLDPTLLFKLKAFNANEAPSRLGKPRLAQFTRSTLFPFALNTTS
jgi:hypothetical protein